MAGLLRGPKKYHLKRNPTQRWHLLRTMATQLVTHERIRTTHRKCLALKQLADKLIAYGKKSILSQNTGTKIFWERRIQGILTTEETRKKLTEILSQRFKDVTGGFTRIVKLKNRENDNAPMGYIEYIGNEIEKYEKAVALENKGKEITKEDFEKKIKEEEKIFFSTKLEEAKENAKIKSLENQKLLQEGKIDQKELISREKINQGVIDFFEKKNKIIEHDIWILNKNKYDLRRYPIYS